MDNYFKILVASVVHCICIIFVWNMSKTINMYSTLWILMTWYFSTRASLATVLRTHPCVSSCLWVKHLDPDECFSQWPRMKQNVLTTSEELSTHRQILSCFFSVTSVYSTYTNNKSVARVTMPWPRIPAQNGIIIIRYPANDTLCWNKDALSAAFNHWRAIFSQCMSLSKPIQPSLVWWIQDNMDVIWVW